MVYIVVFYTYVLVLIIVFNPTITRLRFQRGQRGIIKINSKLIHRIIENTRFIRCNFSFQIRFYYFTVIIKLFNIRFERSVYLFVRIIISLLLLLWRLQYVRATI